jgi:hypothetical protein
MLDALETLRFLDGIDSVVITCLTLRLDDFPKFAAPNLLNLLKIALKSSGLRVLCESLGKSHRRMVGRHPGRVVSPSTTFSNTNNRPAISEPGALALGGR